MNADCLWSENVLEKVRAKMAWVSEKNKDKIPYTTDEAGSYDDLSDPTVSWSPDDGLNWWTNGFWGGIMWLLYRDTGEEKYAEIAQTSEKKLEKCFSDFYGLHHDLVMQNYDAVISPSWSIHCGCGTGSYTFIWAMGGENQAFDDMDTIPITELR